MNHRTCSVEGCERSPEALGYCLAHYLRVHKTGDPRVDEPIRHRMTGSALDDFARLAAIETDECVLWPHPVAGGYARVTIDGRFVPCHVMALEARVGPKPFPTAQACHTPGIGCQKHCINYRHLRWGTPKENAADKLIDGTALVGERSPRAKVAPADVLAIRASRLSSYAIAGRYGITHGTVRNIRQRKTWKHI